MLTNLRTLILLSFATSSLGLAACNTIEGAGHDIENAGEAVQESAD
jgi:predicted small secreted protein